MSGRILVRLGPTVHVYVPTVRQEIGIASPRNSIRRQIVKQKAIRLMTASMWLGRLPTLEHAAGMLVERYLP